MAYHYQKYFELLSLLSLRERERHYTVVSVAPCAEKFNIVSNDNGCTHKCDFSVFNLKYPFWANLVKKKKEKKKKIKTVSVS